jgi:hypothetical protein
MVLIILNHPFKSFYLWSIDRNKCYFRWFFALHWDPVDMSFNSCCIMISMNLLWNIKCIDRFQPSYLAQRVVIRNTSIIIWEPISSWLFRIWMTVCNIAHMTRWNWFLENGYGMKIKTVNWTTKACDSLAVSSDRVADSLDGVFIGNESWFVDRYLSGHQFATGRNNVIPKENSYSRCKKLRSLSAASDYPCCLHPVRIKPEMFHQQYSTRHSSREDQILPWTLTRIIFIHMDNSNDQKVTAQISDAKLGRLLGRHYSSDLNLWDFWLFGMLKHKM